MSYKKADNFSANVVLKRQPLLLSLFYLASLLTIVLTVALPASAQQYPRRQFGDPLSKVHGERVRTYDLEHVLLRVTLNEKEKSISGTSTLTLLPLKPDMDTIEVDSAELEIHSVTGKNAEPLPFELSDGKLRIHLAAPATLSEQVEININYSGKPRKGLYFVGPDKENPDKQVQIWSQGEAEDTHFWFPVYDFPNDKATSEGYYTVNSDFIALSNGQMIGVEQKPGAHTTTYHWKQDIPHSTYLISVVAGKFEKYTEKLGNLPLEYFVPPGTGRDKAMRSFQETPGAIRFFAEKIGIPYPYPKYSQIAVHDFVFGGMENISATTLTDRTLHDAGSEPQVNSMDLITHELSHQWFGDLLTCADWSQIWLNEGFATFWADAYLEHRFGQTEYRYSMYQRASKYMEEDRLRYRRPMVTAYYTDPLDLFDRTTYEKGAVVLDMLRYVMGDDKFFAAISNYAKSHIQSTVLTDDLRKAAEEASGQDLGWFFEEWTTKAGYPEIEVSQLWEESTKTLRLTVSQQQIRNEQTPVFRMPVDIDFKTASGVSRHRIELSSTRQVFEFPLDAKPLLIRFDPDHRVLMALSFPKTAEDLVYQIKNDPSALGRVWASQQVPTTGTGPEFVAAVREALKSDSFWGVREAAATALAQIRTDEAREALSAGLGDSDPRVRQAIVRGLGAYRKDEKAARLVEKSYHKDRSLSVSAEAALAMGRMQGKNAKEILEKALNRESDRDIVRRFALWGLGDLGDKKEWATVSTWLTSRMPTETRIAAVDALLKLSDDHDGRTATKLLGLLDDQDMFVKQRAISALGEGNFQEARDALMRSAKNELDSRLRRTARAALDRLNAGRLKEQSRLPNLAVPAAHSRESIESAALLPAN